MGAKTEDQAVGHLRDFLVFERSESYVPGGAPQSHASAMNAMQAGKPYLVPYSCVGAIRAADEAEAVKAVMGATRRIGKYAVVPTTIVDFTFDLEDQAEGRRVELNP
jgi:hypothetical protein